MLWEDGETTLITDSGYGGLINNLSDIAFTRWHEDNDTWQVWLYRAGEFLQITDDSTWNWSTGFNDAGEIVWPHGMYPETDIMLLRRARDGDFDFDADVDLDDFAILQACLTGPMETDRLCECRFLDLDHDRDVDLADFSTFQNLFTAEE